MGDMLSQAEIDALLGAPDTREEPDYLLPEESPIPEKSILTPEQKDVLGEVGNISIGTAATTLYTLLGHPVYITTPKVEVKTWKELQESYKKSCVCIIVDYSDGLQGSNLMLIDARDAKIIANLMMGGDGSNIAEGEDLNDLELSAVTEAMNQMMGSSATSLSSLLKRRVDIHAPEAFILDFDNVIMQKEYGGKEGIVCTDFRLEVESLIDSHMVQVLPVEFAMDIVDALKGDVTISEEERAELQATTPRPETPLDKEESDMTVQEAAVTSETVIPLSEPVNVQKAQFQSFDHSVVSQQKENIEIIRDVPLEISVELGRTHKLIKEILEFSPGTIIELDKIASEPIDVLVNGKFVAKGEVVVIGENFGIRITDIVSIENRI